MEGHWFIIVNPAAGKGKGVHRLRELCESMDMSGIQYTCVQSERPGHVTTLARQAMKDGHLNFISIGGDGTHHELINGLIAEQRSQVPCIAIINAGTGNDWSKTHNIPRDIPSLVRAMTHGRRIFHNAALAGYARDGVRRQSFFVNVLGAALDGRVVETYPEIFRRIPFLPGYLLAGVRHLLTYNAPDLIIKTEGKITKGRFLTVHAGICKYSGGGMRFVPQADPTSSTLSITCVGAMSKVRLFCNIHRLYTGSLLTHPLVQNFHSTTLTLESAGTKPVPIEADGEFLGYTPLEVRLIPRVFMLVTAAE